MAPPKVGRRPLTAPLMGVGLPTVDGTGKPVAEDLVIEDPVEAVMSKAKMDAMQARLDVMAVAVTALARAVPAERAAAVQEVLWREVAQRLDGLALSPKADATVAADLSRLVRALGGLASWEADRATLPG